MRKWVLITALCGLGFTSYATADEQATPFAPLDAVVEKGLALPDLNEVDPGGLQDKTDEKMTVTAPGQRQTLQQPATPAVKPPVVHRIPPKPKQQRKAQQQPLESVNTGISGLHHDTDEEETNQSHTGFDLHL